MSLNYCNSDLYAVLSVTPAASFTDIRAAYKKAALQAHPDKGGSSEKFRQVTFAFETLSQEAARAAYDKRRLRSAPGQEVRKKPCVPKRETTDERERSCANAKPSPTSSRATDLLKALNRLRRLLQAMGPEQREATILHMTPAIRNKLFRLMESAKAEKAYGCQPRCIADSCDDDLSDGSDASSTSDSSSDSNEECMLPIEDGSAYDDSAEKRSGKSRRFARGVNCTRSMSRATIMTGNVLLFTKFQKDLSVSIGHHVTLASVRRAVAATLRSGNISDEDFRRIVVDAFDASSSPVRDVGLRGQVLIMLGCRSTRTFYVNVQAAAQVRQAVCFPPTHPSMTVRVMSVVCVTMLLTSCSAKGLTADQQASIAVCLIDVDQALVYLGYAGLAIDAVHVDCAKSAPIADCSAVISAIIGSFSWGAVYLLAIASSCSMREIRPTQRAGALTEIVASLADISFGASSITQDCDPIAADYSRIGYAANRAAEATACAFDADLGGTFLARAGLQIRDAAVDCPNKGAKRECAINIGAVFASISWVAQFLSLTATDCPKYINARAACAADVAAIVAGATQIGVSSVALSILFPPTQQIAPIIPFGRRLEDVLIANGNMSYPSGRVLSHDSRMHSGDHMHGFQGDWARMFDMWARAGGNGTTPHMTPELAVSLMHEKLSAVERRMTHQSTVLV